MSVRGREDVKDLGRLNRDLARVVLVDDNAWSFLLQPANGVPAVPYLGSPHDGCGSAVRNGSLRLSAWPCGTPHTVTVSHCKERDSQRVCPGLPSELAAPCSATRALTRPDSAPAPA